MNDIVSVNRLSSASLNQQQNQQQTHSTVATNHNSQSSSRPGVAPVNLPSSTSLVQQQTRSAVATNHNSQSILNLETMYHHLQNP